MENGRGGSGDGNRNKKKEKKTNSNSVSFLLENNKQTNKHTGAYTAPPFYFQLTRLKLARGQDLLAS